VTSATLYAGDNAVECYSEFRRFIGGLYMVLTSDRAHGLNAECVAQAVVTAGINRKWIRGMVILQPTKLYVDERFHRLCLIEVPLPSIITPQAPTSGDGMFLLHSIE
jgi:hypothetical protein